ncbi:MAG: hypothetical protein KKD48_01535 [Nanoarchaeota archaeon]|nr:hypothetical protein [Nanoarchaeota archaeon]
MKNKKRLRKNPAAIFSFLIIAISGFIFPLFSFNIFGEIFSDKSGVMFNLIVDLFSGNISFSKGYEILTVCMIFVYLLIVLFYLLNGLGIIYNRYSRYASFLSFIYLFFGLFAVVLINRETSIPFLGNTLGSMRIGLGTYLITITGVLYLFFVRKINSVIKF